MDPRLLHYDIVCLSVGSWNIIDMEILIIVVDFHVVDFHVVDFHVVMSAKSSCGDCFEGLHVLQYVSRSPQYSLFQLRFPLLASC
jgi:hypothetical protein